MEITTNPLIPRKETRSSWTGVLRPMWQSRSFTLQA